MGTDQPAGASATARLREPRLFLGPEAAESRALFFELTAAEASVRKKLRVRMWMAGAPLYLHASA